MSNFELENSYFLSKLAHLYALLKIIKFFIRLYLKIVLNLFVKKILISKMQEKLVQH